MWYALLKQSCSPSNISYSINHSVSNLKGEIFLSMKDSRKYQVFAMGAPAPPLGGYGIHTHGMGMVWIPYPPNGGVGVRW